VVGGVALMIIGGNILLLGAMANFFKINSEDISEETKRKINLSRLRLRANFQPVDARVRAHY
jgi:hypothetical protein